MVSIVLNKDIPPNLRFFIDHRLTFGIYVKVCGSEKINYNYRLKIFDSNGYNVIFFHLNKETHRWKDHLLNYLRLFTNYRSQTLN